MGNTDQTIVKQAVAHFKKGDFQQAKACYQQAANQYGAHLFADSIRLCELRMARFSADPSSLIATGHTKVQLDHPAFEPVSIPNQLEVTQKLLEHYYTRCQELEYQLMESK